jgi:hypothetical protein
MNTGTKILFVICAIVIAAGVAIYVNASAYQKKSKITQGTVVITSISQYEIKYTSDDGIERIYKKPQSRNKHASRTYHDGEIVKVFYQIDNPDDCTIHDGKKEGRNFVFWGSMLLLFNVFMVYTNTKRARISNSFKTTGRKVEAQILKIDIDMETTVLNRHPYYILCKWVDPMSGREYLHTIKNIWDEPKVLLAGRNTIDVYIDRNDPEKYFMDIEFLGPAAK